MTARLSLEDRLLRQLEQNLAAAHRERAPWWVRAGLVSATAFALTSMDATAPVVLMHGGQS